MYVYLPKKLGITGKIKSEKQQGLARKRGVTHRRLTPLNYSAKLTLLPLYLGTANHAKSTSASFLNSFAELTPVN